MWCPHPLDQHKKKDYGFAYEILCRRCWKSLKVKSFREDIRNAWLRRFLNKIRELASSGDISTRVKGPDGGEIILVNTYFIRRLAEKLGMDEETVWRYALCLDSQNVDGIIKPTVIPYDGYHRAITIQPADKECEPYPFPIADLNLMGIVHPKLVGKDRDFKVEVWLDYYFDQATRAFLGIHDDSKWIGYEETVLNGFSESHHLVVNVSPLSQTGRHNLELTCLLWDGEKWAKSFSLPIAITVEEIKTSGQRALALSILGAMGGLLFKRLAPLTFLLGLVLGGIAGDHWEYEELRGQREKQLE